MQKQTAKMKSTRKMGKKNLDWKSQPWGKVNCQSQRKSTVWSTMTSADAVADDVSRWRGRWRHLGLTSVGENWCVQRVVARGRAWRCVERVINRTETLSGAWGRVRSPMALRLSRFCRSAQDDLCGSFKTVIGAMFVAVMLAAVVCAVWNSLTTAAAGPEPKDDGWMTSEVQRRKAMAVVVMAEAMLKKKKKSHTDKDKTAKKRSEQWLWYHVRNNRGFVLYFIMRKYTSVPYIGGISVRFKWLYCNVLRNNSLLCLLSLLVDGCFLLYYETMILCIYVGW